MNPATKTMRPFTHLPPKSSHSGSRLSPRETRWTYSIIAPYTAGMVKNKRNHSHPSSVFFTQSGSSNGALNAREISTPILTSLVGDAF